MVDSFFHDNHLNTENYRLRMKLEKLQSEGYLATLISNNAEELALKDRKIQRLENKNEKLSEKFTAKCKKCRELDFDLRMAQLEIKELKNRLIEKDNEKDCLLQKIHECNKDSETKLSEQEALNKAIIADREGIIQKLTAQINRNYTNSSIPSSLCIGHKTIHNGREKSGLKPGGQPGHKGHPRKKQVTTSQVKLEAPCTCISCAGKKLTPTGEYRTRQLVDLKITVSASDLVSSEYCCEECGVRFYSEFPDEMPNEVNYGPEIKSMAVLLNNYCNVSMDKSVEVIRELTAGVANISKGTLSNWSREFSVKSSDLINETTIDVRQAPLIHTDATVARVNGKNANIFVFANKNGKVYTANEHKGFSALIGSPVDDYQGILVHDHDRSFYSFGSKHQECNVHVIRYLKDAMENEPHLHWHKAMYALLMDMHYCRNALIAAGAEDMVQDTVSEYHAKYSVILDEADKEYLLHPPSKYYKEGLNLAKRLRKYKDSHMLFLENFIVPFDNNLSERSLRTGKRKAKAAGAFRSLTEGLKYYCDFLSVIESGKCKGINVYDTVRKVFSGKVASWSDFGLT